MPDRAALTCSVIVPAYNAEGTLVRALDSIKSQTVHADEIIVVDDGSADNSAAIAERWGAKVIRQSNAGPSVARNTGAKASSGEVLFFLDSDDRWRPTKIERHLKVYETLQTRPAFVFDRCQRVRSENRETGVGGSGPEGSVEWFELFDSANWTCGSCPSMPKLHWAEVGGFNENLRLAEDIEILMCLGTRFGPGYRIAQICTDYMLTDESLSRQPRDMVEVVQQFKGRLPAMTAEMERKLLTTLIMGNALYAPPGTFLETVSPLGLSVFKDSRFFRFLALRLLHSLKLRKI